MTVKKAIINNIAHLYAIQLFRLGMPLAVLSFLSKIVNGEQYGIYIYALANAAWLSIIIEYGFNVSATRRISAAEDSKLILEIIKQTQTGRWLLVGVSLIYLVWSIGISSMFDAYPEWALSAWLLGVMTGITPTYYYQAHSRLRSIALLEAGGGVVIFFAVIFCIHGEKDFWLLCIILVGVRMFIWLFLEKEILAKHQLQIRDFFVLRNGLIALKDGWRIFLVQLAASVYTSFNIVLLGVLSTPHAVAVYGSGERMIRVGLTLIGQATSAIFPHLNELRLSDATRLKKLRRLLLYAFSIGALICMLIIWSVAPLIANIFFNGKLPGLILIIRIMAFVVPAIAVSNVLAMHYLIVDHREGVVNKVVFLGVPIGLVLGSFLSLKYAAVGMAVAWVGVEWFVALALAAHIRRRNHRNL